MSRSVRDPSELEAERGLRSLFLLAVLGEPGLSFSEEDEDEFMDDEDEAEPLS